MQIDDFNARRTSLQTALGAISCVDAGTGPATLFVHGLLLDPGWSTPRSGRAFERYILNVRGDELVAIEEDLRRLDVPTVLIWGPDDQFFGSWAPWLRDTIPGVREIVEIEGGHLFTPLERPDDVVAALRAHWAALQEPATAA